YAPKAKLLIRNWQDDADLKSQISNLNFNPAKTYVIAHTHVPGAQAFARVTVLPAQPDGFAQQLYAELHRCDDAGAELIVVEKLPEGERWQGITDRLRRAASAG